MSAETMYRCDLCGELINRDDAALVQAGLRSKPFPVGTVDLCLSCQNRPVKDVLAHLEGQ